MKMDTELLRAKFPPGFPVEKLPEGAKEEEIVVYRICRSGDIDEASFLPTYLDEISKTKENDGDDHEIDFYSISTYEKENEARRMLKFFRGKSPQAVLASGITAPACGPCQRTKERKKGAKSHVDWWLYQNARPHIYFQKINDKDGDENGDPKTVF